MGVGAGVVMVAMVRVRTGMWGREALERLVSPLWCVMVNEDGLVGGCPEGNFVIVGHRHVWDAVLNVPRPFVLVYIIFGVESAPLSSKRIVPG